MPSPRERAVLAALASSISSCAIGAGGVLTHNGGEPAVVVGGPSIEGQAQLPFADRMVGGFEWTRGDTQADLWRAGLLAGYSFPPERSALGWEATAHAGVLRSWTGSTTGAGGFAGLHLGALLRLGRAAEPWEGDSLLQVAPLLVGDLGVNGLFPPGSGAATEVTFRVLLRVQFSSTLLP